MKKALILAVVGLTIFLTGCVQQTPTADQGANQPADVDQNQNVNQQQDITYKDPAYGFTLTFPQTWKGFATKTETSNWTKGVPNAGDTIIKTIYFGFPAQPDIFGISVFTKEQWGKIQALDLPEAPKISLGENSQYIFAEVWSQFAANSEMAERREEMHSITKTFSVI